MEQAHPPGPHPPHPPPPPAIGLDSPVGPLETAEKTDSSRLESLSQLGHGASSSIWLMGLSLSNRVAHTVQLYSYIGILVSFA